MHLLIPFASVLAEAGRHTMGTLRLPRLQRLLERLEPQQALGSDEYSLTPPHERALAHVLGWDADGEVPGDGKSMADGCWPWAARAAAADGIDTGSAAWGLLTPVHWRVGADSVGLADPASLALDDGESRALLEAVRDLFESEGWRIAYGAPLRWYAAHDMLRDFPSASIDRVIGRNVDLWLGGDQRVDERLRRVRRLQNEVQMLLYTHPINDQREARGEAAVNSFWLSGCGPARGGMLPKGLIVDDRLRAPALQEDWPAWGEHWQALDAGPVAALAEAARTGGEAAITLCGERRAWCFEARPQSWWARIGRRLQPRSLADVLASL